MNIQLPNKETKENQGDMITQGKPYVEALRKKHLVKKTFSNERLCM